MDFTAKILSTKQLLPWREMLRNSRRKLVVTNGCFDLLHSGHAFYLQEAKRCGDVLLVGITADAGVRKLKGPGRPINSQSDRATLIAALHSVDAVHVFAELEAIQFLKKVQPDVYVKGGDYTLESINQRERKFLEEVGCEIKILPLVKGKSSRSLIEKIKADR